ncbi:hypothetical protein LCGC14_1183100 [marine sediment metagenome]|uniref:PD-(D/E)XK endonuclease-like domain-containing protein n=1 Tax=marine sediment metagenome TaxID=412755 RepID=A0A0F9LLP0_9ZZZZ
MRTIKISGGISAVIATGSFQNLKPSFLWEETLTECELTDDEIRDRIQTLYNKSFAMLKEAEQKAIIERIQRERKDLRFMISPSMNILPSVTSIINYDADFFISPEELTQYAAQGNVIDTKVKHFIRTGKWVLGKDIKENWTDIIILTKGSLRLDIDVGDFPAFLKKYPISDMKVGERFFFDEEGYCGEPDFIGVPDFKDAEKIPTVFDVKRTASKIKNGMQLAAYAKKFNIQQGIIIPLSDKTGQGFSKPIVYDKEKLSGYYQMFKAKQKEFKKRYNI